MTFLFVPEIIASRFGRQLYKTLIVDLLKNLSDSVFLKCLSIKSKNFPPTLVLTDSLYGGLNHVTFLISMLKIFC